MPVLCALMPLCRLSKEGMIVVLTKITSHRLWRHRRAIPWSLGCLTWLIVSWIAVVWAQVPGLPSLLGARVEGVSATSDVVVDVTLDGASTLSGRVLDANGIPVFFATVFAQSATEVYSGAVRFDEGLQYRMVLPDGTYHVSLMMSVFDATGMIPGMRLTNITLDLPEAVVISGDTMRDFMAPALPPLFNVTGQAFNFGMLPLPSQAMLVFQSEDRRIWNFADIAFTDGDTHATYSVFLPAGTYHVFVSVILPDLQGEANPDVPRQISSLPAGMITVSADQMSDVTVPSTVNLSGLLQDNLGNALAGAAAMAVSELPQMPPALPSAVCNADNPTSVAFAATATAFLPEGNTLGQYENLLVPGDYQVWASAPVELLPPATMPPSPLAPQHGLLMFPFPADMLTITADQIRDFILPSLSTVVLISGRVVDRQNQPVAGARVTATSAMLTGIPNTSFSNDIRTNQMGDYQLLVLSGVDYTIRALYRTKI